MSSARSSSMTHRTLSASSLMASVLKLYTAIRKTRGATMLGPSSVKVLLLAFAVGVYLIPSPIDPEPYIDVFQQGTHYYLGSTDLPFLPVLEEWS